MAQEMPLSPKNARFRCEDCGAVFPQADIVRRTVPPSLSLSSRGSFRTYFLRTVPLCRVCAAERQICERFWGSVGLTLAVLLAGLSLYVLTR
jgi:hypothetical protein